MHQWWIVRRNKRQYGFILEWIVMIPGACLRRCGAQFGNNFTRHRFPVNLHQCLYLYVLNKPRVDYTLARGPLSRGPSEARGPLQARGQIGSNQSNYLRPARAVPTFQRGGGRAVIPLRFSDCFCSFFVCCSK